MVSLLCAEARATSMFVAPVAPSRGVVSESEADAMTRAVESAVLAKVVGVDVITPAALDNKLELDLINACKAGAADDASCVVDFAQSMGVQYVLRSSLVKLDDTSVLTISLYDGRRASLLGQASRTDRSAAKLLSTVPGLVAEVAQSGGLSVVAERPRPSAAMPIAEIVGGSVVVLGSALTHVVSFLVVEPAYQRAEFDRQAAGTWEFTRPFAFAVPVLGYIGGAALIGVGVWTFPTEES